MLRAMKIPSKTFQSVEKCLCRLIWVAVNSIQTVKKQNSIIGVPYWLINKKGGVVMATTVESRATFVLNHVLSSKNKPIEVSTARIADGNFIETTLTPSSSKLVLCRT